MRSFKPPNWPLLKHFTKVSFISIVGFSLPFLLYDAGNPQSKVGFIYGSVAILEVIWGYFCMPETKKRSLEELEELWLVGVPVRKFGSYKLAHETRCIGLRILQLERYAGAGDLGSTSCSCSSSDEDDEDAPNERRFGGGG